MDAVQGDRHTGRRFPASISLGGRTLGHWIARLGFVICCAMVLLMAVHGDEHGRRPRFVWRSFEDTIKVTKAVLSTDRTGDAADIAPPSLAIVAEMIEVPSRVTIRHVSAALADRTAARASYLLPFSNGPPARA